MAAKQKLIPSDRGQPTKQQWAAIVDRDADLDGAFYYAVATTGIYCRPSCPARTPKQSNVRCYRTTIEARGAGFRACKRCRPDALTESPHTEKVVEACRYIEQAERIPTLDELASLVQLSPYHFHRIFKSATGLTPRQYAVSVREERMRGQLSEDARVTDAIYDAGYGSSSRFYERADNVLGMSARRYRDRGQREVIRFAMGETSMGTILVAQSEHGVCAIYLGDDPDALLQQLQDRFSKAELIGADAQFEATVAIVVGIIEDPSAGCDLPLDIRGSVFQQRVWQALREVEPGETLSYAELANRIGSPRSVRAVANACAKNEIAVAIPCHRIVRSDGAISGYRWGVARKRELLARETL